MIGDPRPSSATSDAYNVGPVYVIYFALEMPSYLGRISEFTSLFNTTEQMTGQVIRPAVSRCLPSACVLIQSSLGILDYHLRSSGGLLPGGLRHARCIHLLRDAGKNCFT